jgi:hypothetical protein
VHDLQCIYCKKEVTSYGWVMKFTFVEGRRLLPLRWAYLSCGCEILNPDWVYDDETNEMWLICPRSDQKIIQWIERDTSDAYPFG